MTNPVSTLPSDATTFAATLARWGQFAWLLENAGDDRNPFRLHVLWQWAGDMVFFQEEANRTGKPVRYMQRGQLMRVLHPETPQADFIEPGPFPNVEPDFIDATPEDEVSMRGKAA